MAKVKNAPESSKKGCPITRAEFRKSAKPLTLTISAPDGGQVMVPVNVKEFSTGSIGWYHNGKIAVPVNGTLVDVQLGLNFTIVHSKELPAD
jgi:hypothetical protein